MITAEAPAKLPPLLKRAPVVRLLIIALLAEIGYAVLNVSTMPIYLQEDRRFGESVIGLVLVAFLLSEAVFKSPMGHLADRYGHKMLMMFGPLLSVGTSLLSLVVPHTGGQPIEVVGFILLRALDGIGAAMLWPAAFAAMSDTVEDNERQQAMSLLNLCYMLGIALALPVGGFVNDLTGAKYASLILAAGLFAAVAIVVWRLVPLYTVHKHGDLGEMEGMKFSDFIKSAKQIPTFLILAIVTFAGIGFPMAIVKLFAKDQFNMSESAFGLLVLPGAAAMAILSVPMSRLGERLGRARAVHLGMGMCAVGMSLIAAGAVVPALRQPWILAVGGMPVGVGFLLAIPAWMASVSDIDPKKRAANLGAVMTAQGLGAIIGAPIGSTLYEKLQPIGIRLALGPDFGRYAPFVGCAACVTAGWLLGLKILKPQVGR